MKRAGTVLAVLLCAAAAGAIVQSANASIVGRVGGVAAALVLAGVGLAAQRGQRWAFGAAFLLAVCWVWATLALAVQGAIGAIEAVIWLTWSIVVIVASVAGRGRDASSPRFPPLDPVVGEDDRDG